MRAPKFLDKCGGFYCRLDEPVGVVDGDGGQREKADDFSEGVMEDDGETLLQRKASRRSSRWRRSSRRKQRETEGDPAGMEKPEEGQAEAPGCQEVVIQVAVGAESAGGHGEPTLVHFATREEADDWVLIQDTERGHDGEGEEERRAAREQEEGMKMVKRMAAKNYRKVSKSRKCAVGEHLHKFQIKIFKLMFKRLHKRLLRVCGSQAKTNTHTDTDIFILVRTLR